ncbi:hypothetical protein ACFOQM_16570 [Paenibacillus sp. GCM10012307]|uniref:Uncharacterized protein n=1 Tax=Paenibacillus roseus TaxID=2798579 RepID=A0A934MS16_9BACL|nr:hypothetical protein [Paenibacillus roseus]MBJ6362859.1 hypothetical protein [Paenibacillus roseus]
MVGGWVTWLLILFGIIVAVVGVIAYMRMVSTSSSDRPISKPQSKEKGE